MAQGEVEITLDGRKESLRPSLGAAKKVNASFGGFSAAFRRVVENDFDAFVTIIAAGLGKTAEEVEERVFLAGLNDLSEPVAKFIGFLSNGGRDPKEKAKKKEGEA